MMKKHLYGLVATLFLALAGALHAGAQGCVAIRHFSTCVGNSAAEAFLPQGEWQLGMNYRYFKSFRHFRGRAEEPDRVSNNTEVINWAHALDINLSYGLSPRLYASLSLPFVINVRSSLYEHGRSERHTTFSRGLADVRAGLGYWLLSPERHARTNLALGLSVKLPTGDYNATDIFYNVGPGGEPQVRPVDQSIQPGDGGFGLVLDFQFFQGITESIFFYSNGFYLANPREANGVRTFRETLSPLLANEAIMSVPDQFSVSAGLSRQFSRSGFALSFGARYEGVPIEDLIGGSQGFRRPGSVLSFEPGISYVGEAAALSLAVPIAMLRDRPQSVTDLETQRLTGQTRHGDAAFADYLVNLGISFRLGRRHGDALPPVPDWGELR
jgi:hypothetical protein